MIADITQPVRRAIAWTLVVVASLGFLTLGLAENSVKGAVMSPVPNAPLPFPRHKVVAIDLREYSSLEAVQWLQAGGVEPYAMIIAPVDADIVSALTEPQALPSALAAMDAMIQSANGVPLAACLWKPSSTKDGPAVAEAVADALLERYPGAIAYLAACGDAANWHADISRAVRGKDRSVLSSDTLVPLSAGAPLTLVTLREPDALDTTTVLANLPSASGYSGVVVRVTQPPGATFSSSATELMSNLAALSLVVIRPERQVDPLALDAALRGISLAATPLPEGFTSVTAPGITIQGDWILSTVGTVPYARTTTDGAMTMEFVGTNLYVQALTSPDGGKLTAWIDPPEGAASPAPDIVIDLKDPQAEDTAVRIASGLPAARHRLVLSAANVAEKNQNISISGFVVTGHATPGPVTRLAAVVFIAIAIAALAERTLASISAIREGERRHPRRQPGGHPRVFNR